METSEDEVMIHHDLKFRNEISIRMLNEFPIFDYEDIQLIPNKCIIKSTFSSIIINKINAEHQHI